MRCFVSRSLNAGLNSIREFQSDTANIFVRLRALLLLDNKNNDKDIKDYSALHRQQPQVEEMKDDVPRSDPRHRKAWLRGQSIQS